MTSLAEGGICGHCGNEAQLTCSKCKSIQYCKRDCQKAHWKKHKKECKVHFSLEDIDNPNHEQASKARCPTIPHGTLYYDHFARKSNEGLVMDRVCVAGPHNTAWAEGKGDFYVATDVASLLFSETTMDAGQYFKAAPGMDGKQDNWARFNTGKDAPGNLGGFHKVVIDTAQPGSRWTLSANMANHSLPHVSDPMRGPSFVALTREGHPGFVHEPDDASKDQCRNHLKIKDFGPLTTTGKFLIEDALNADGDIEVPMDGYYPVTLHKDLKGELAMIMIWCWPVRGIHY